MLEQTLTNRSAWALGARDEQIGVGSLFVDMMDSTRAHETNSNTHPSWLEWNTQEAN